MGDPSGMVKNVVHNLGYFQKQEGFPTRTRTLLLPKSPVLVPKHLSPVPLKNVPNLLSCPDILFPSYPSFSAHDFASYFTMENEGLRLFHSTHSFLLPHRPPAPRVTTVSVDGGCPSHLGSSHSCLSISCPWHSHLCHRRHSRPPNPCDNRVEYK